MDIRELTIEQLDRVFKTWQVPLFHSKQVFAWIYQKGALSFDEMGDLSKELRSRLKEQFSLQRLSLVKMQVSADKTKKFLFKFPDGNYIESVYIPAKKTNTACLSTQIGCKYSCKFCASGIGGFRRNLRTWEIIAQLQEICRRIKQKPDHVVFMGTGEPLDNYDFVLTAVRIINCRYGFNIGARRITISTCGIIPGIERLAKENLQVELSVSLHASDDKRRCELLPVNKKYPLKDLIRTCRKYSQQTKRQVTFEYVLIKNINSSREAVANLVKLLKGWECKVNIIPYNRIRGFSYQPPDKSEVYAFKKRIQDAGIPVTVRVSRGEDIAGACGQLRADFGKSR